MPKVTINGRTVEVEAGTNLIEAGLKVGVQIPHYCYHPRLSVVGQCRMCLVEITENGRKMPKPQAACSMQVMKDGWEVRTDVPEIEQAQQGMMEFFLINHPLDCPICDQAGECGLQDYSFKHGVAFSRFRYEDKRTYPGRERIPLGANVLLNMNRCIQCTRCVRFTHEIAGTGELGFFNRGARAEIGTFPGKELNNDLATCVVDLCPVGALTSTRFRFAERVFYLDKKPSICTGCEVGCNITVEHRRGAIKRYKPRFNVEVNDYWMCDSGRSTFERYKALPRLASPRVKRGVGAPTGPIEAKTDPIEAKTGPIEARTDPMKANSGRIWSTGSWDGALDLLAERLADGGTIAVLGSGFLTTEEAYLLGKVADQAGTPHRSVPVDLGPQHRIPNTKGGITGREAAPNRRGAELAGLAPGDSQEALLGYEALTSGDGAARCDVLIVADSDFGAAAHDPKVVERLRRAKLLVVFGWADTPLAQAADLALPVANAVERDGTFVNVEWRVQRCERAMPAPGQARPLVEVLSELLSRSDRSWGGLTAGAVFDRLASSHPAFAGLSWHDLPATGATLKVEGAPSGPGAQAAASASEASA